MNKKDFYNVRRKIVPFIIHVAQATTTNNSEIDITVGDADILIHFPTLQCTHCSK